ncbi:MAG: 4Fe-4S dicluster domain-containing protein [Spirochaetales bacterium]|nr:4Fe-4S dicluster domain-containing protein [Spirochaetales bacterium]
MGTKKVSQKDFEKWVEKLIGLQKVFGVQSKDDKYEFGALLKAENLRLDYDITILPPKKYFLPSTEQLFSFGESGFNSSVDGEPFILFGVHPYDFVAIRQLDVLFSMKNNDVYYQTRRNAATIIVCDVENISENAFSGFLGFDHVEKGFDLLVTKTGSDYLVESGSDKGKKLLSLMENAVDAQAADISKRSEKWKKNRELLKKQLLKANVNELPAALGKAYDHKIWNEKAEKCFSCGSCNLVCPTCYCFDVQDDFGWDLKSGERTRSWDGCMIENFATVAGDHNFRKNKSDRYRHRYYRKGKYVPEKIGEIACVGCGRCISACVARIANPVEIFNAVAEA